jgi:tetratricopeptide (TPR) repeat protein
MKKKKQQKPADSGPSKRAATVTNGENRPRPDKKAEPKPAATLRERWWLVLLLVLPAVMLGTVLFLNAVKGEFVYDDQRQIVRNSLIQDPTQAWHALTSDVWAFKGSGIAASNYWRPTFVGWMILNYRFFGVEQSLPWHITNIVLNVGVIVLAFFLLRRFGLSSLVAGTIVILFAAHPAHTESVAWISGSPDLLMALGLLGSLWFVRTIRERSAGSIWFWALVFFAIALGAKESAIFFPLAVFAVFWRFPGSNETRGRAAPEAVMQCAPFVILAVIYFVMRIGVLGQFAEPPVDAPSFGSMLLSIPSAFAFYLRQIVFPYWIGPSYPLRPVTIHTLGWWNFVLPLIVSAASLVAMFWLARRSMVQRVGFALFVLTLFPAMNISAFIPEQMVHDRYLYLPLLGFLMMTIPELARWAERVVADRPQRVEWALFGLAALLCIPLGLQTVRNNRAWLSNMALWERSIQVDPNSSWNYQQYGAELLEKGKPDEALVAYDRSIAIHPNPPALMGRGRGYQAKGKMASAEADFQSVIDLPNERVPAYTLYQAYEGLSINYQQQHRWDDAAALIRKGRVRLYPYAAALTEKLSVVLYQQNKKAEAIKELEQFQPQAETETLPESKIVLMRLGALYGEMNRKEEARTMLQRYLALTSGLQDPQTLEARKQTQAMLKNLNQNSAPAG